jgi:serine/threonine protein phosphatase PrpC
VVLVGVWCNWALQVKAADPSGATASVALVCGRVVTVAGVGDSYVVLDTGSQILRLSPDHRVDNSEAERQRCTVRRTSSGRFGGPPCGTRACKGVRLG